MQITVCQLTLGLPGCLSLKEKRGRLKPLLHRLHKDFGLAVAEIGRQDSHNNAVVACVTVSGDSIQNHRVLESAIRWVESNRMDILLHDCRLESR